MSLRTRRSPCTHSTSGQAGFTLAELATVMVILGLLLGGLMMTLSTQLDVARESETRKSFDTIREALIGYAISRAGSVVLPCPDTNGDGLEEARVAGVCPSQEGWLPATTLGLSRSDPWGNRYRYRVDITFSSTTPPFTLASVATPRVCQNNACTQILASNVPAVWVSHGPNGLGARGDGFVLHPQPTGVDERGNTDGRNLPDTADTGTCSGGTTNLSCSFVSHEKRETAGTGGEFDDLVGWLPAPVLFNRLVAAGRLP
ncbi:type II secretion system protein [Parachitinimonas caeni]|uniref:Type II secretion system protein n=1 Tax=Parachitinimonas caeni TaxID=3031301 RepID=A0ABT7DSX9_9NEIS|nr:type II secretion system protein [Parachitinimonas caeni]MDK2123172.1 type II secretion system protein [Parachitinimonas caeni]